MTTNLLRRERLPDFEARRDFFSNEKDDLFRWRSPSDAHNHSMFDRYSQSALTVIFLSRWVAAKRGAESIESEDLLESLIREDQGEFPSIHAEMNSGMPIAMDQGSVPTGFFSEDEARNLLNALEKPTHDALDLASDMPIGHSIKKPLESAVRIADRMRHRTIEPLHLLAGIVEHRESQLARLLHENGITQQRGDQALGLNQGVE
jgi:ATP-dependent Clp protease ATP-binding subunit ClpA